MREGEVMEEIGCTAGCLRSMLTIGPWVIIQKSKP